MAILDLPDPDLVSSQRQIFAKLTDAKLALCRAQLARRRPSWRTIGDQLGIGQDNVSADLHSRITFMVETKQPADPGTHDEFFRIRRTSNHAAERFIAALFRGLAILREDVESAPTRLETDRIAQLADALAQTLAVALNADRHVGRRTFKPAPQTPPLDYSAKRWIRGHQLFAILSQALIFALNTLGEADEAGFDEGMREASALTADLLQASACALELTGDFPQAIYNASIRTSMESPFLPDGFSGLLSNDHRQLVLRMKLLRPSIERLHERHPDCHALIFEKLDGVYQSHKHVCARFVGPEQSSLLMAQSSGRSAVEQIERFRQMRLRSWGPSHDGG